MTSDIRIAPARTDTDLAAAAALFRDYEASLDIDLGYQHFTSELASLPGNYAPPRGELLLAWNQQGAAVGCVALRPMKDSRRCEMKRLYVSPGARCHGVGKSLMETLIGCARRIGYDEMWLDTLASMTAAQALYRAAGFTRAEPYYSPVPAGTVFMRLRFPDSRSADSTFL